MNINLRRHATALPRPLRGYTLLEIILVMGILMVSFTIVTPRLAGFVNSWTLETEAYKVKAKIRQTQQMAITSQRMCRVGWVPAMKYYSLYKHNGASFIIVEDLSLMHNIVVDHTTFSFAGPNNVDFDQHGAPSEGGDVFLRDSKGNMKQIHITQAIGRVDVY